MIRLALRFHSIARALLLALMATLLKIPAAAQTPATPGPQTATGVAAGGAELPASVVDHLNQLNRALKTARARRDGSAQAATLNQIGRVHYLTSDYPQSVAAYAQALAVAHTGKNAVAEAAALSGTANCDRAQGQNEKAIELYHQALDLATASGDERGQAEALNGLGWSMYNQDKSDEAMGFLTRALPLAVKAGDVDLQALIVNGTGLVYDATEQR